MCLSFSFFFSFWYSWQKIYLTMTGLEQGISGIGSYHSTNWATITAFNVNVLSDKDVKRDWAVHMIKLTNEMLCHSWQSGRFRHQRTWVRIQPLASFIVNLFLLTVLKRWKIKKKETGKAILKKIIKSSLKKLRLNLTYRLPCCDVFGV